MLDVHPPHEAAHTWRDFFIHIATIVCGLLIAIGLEQSVEWVHHRQERQELREALERERIENRDIYPLNVAWYRLDRAIILNNLRIVQWLQQHPGTPEEDLPGTLRWGYAYEPVVTTAYTNAQQTQTLGLLPQQETESLAAFYDLLKQAQDATYHAAVKALSAGDFAAIDPDPSHLPPTQVAAAMQTLLEAANRNREWGIWLQHLRDSNPDFPPGPTHEEIIQSSGWERSAEDKAALATAYARTQKALAPFQAAVDGLNKSNQEQAHKP
jgi:hypothetical protein